MTKAVKGTFFPVIEHFETVPEPFCFSRRNAASEEFADESLSRLRIIQSPQNFIHLIAAARNI